MHESVPSQSKTVALTDLIILTRELILVGIPDRSTTLHMAEIAEIQADPIPKILILATTCRIGTARSKETDHIRSTETGRLAETGHLLGMMTGTDQILETDLVGVMQGSQVTHPKVNLKARSVPPLEVEVEGKVEVKGEDTNDVLTVGILIPDSQKIIPLTPIGTDGTLILHSLL
jgi:hypothetical protein